MLYLAIDPESHAVVTPAIQECLRIDGEPIVIDEDDSEETLH